MYYKLFKYILIIQLQSLKQKLNYPKNSEKY